MNTQTVVTSFSCVPHTPDGVSSCAIDLKTSSRFIGKGGGGENLRIGACVLPMRHKMAGFSMPDTLRTLKLEGIPDGYRISFWAERRAMVHGPRRSNVFGGIGGDTLE